MRYDRRKFDAYCVPGVDRADFREEKKQIYYTRNIDNKHSKKHKRIRQNRYLFHWKYLSKPFKFFIISLILFIILQIIIMGFSHEYLIIFSWIVLYTVEISGLTALLFKVDKIRTNTTLRVWGLRLLSFVFMFIGLYSLFFYWYVSFFSFLFFLKTPQGWFWEFLSFLILGMGFLLIGGYLQFKFMRKSGVIIHRGVGW